MPVMNRVVLQVQVTVAQRCTQIEHWLWTNVWPQAEQLTFDPTSSTTLDGAGLIAGIDVVSRDGSGVEQDADSTVTNLNDDR